MTDKEAIRIAELNRLNRLGIRQAGVQARQLAADTSTPEGRQVAAKLQTTSDRMTGGTGPDGNPVRGQGLPAAEA